MNIYVGNLAYEVSEDELEDLFSKYGEVISVTIIKDRQSGSSKGFGFVEMPIKEEAEIAITELNGKELKGRKLTVSQARPRKPDQFGGNRRRDDRRKDTWGRKRY